MASSPQSAVDWLIPPQRYNHTTSGIDIGRNFIRYAIEKQQVLVFRIEKNDRTSTGYSLDYRLAFDEPYLAISHSWTDRTGPGDSIKITDLAPWPITISPAKRHLLDWLYDIQGRGEPWTSWYWLDLFCIDQTRVDEYVFSKQLEQIPMVFFRAKRCLALLASWPCQEAILHWKENSACDESKGDEQWDGVVKWLYDHNKKCSCSPTLDAWLTRVWTRQEVLYSKALTMLPANVWLAGATELSENLWTVSPAHYVIPAEDGGIRELASMLVTWAAEYGSTPPTMSSARIASATRQLLCGENADFPAFTSNEEPAPVWHSFNWAMIVDSSIRFTTHVRDAILSQMLLLPGYRVPQEPWSMPLQDLMLDSCIQYLRELRRWQIVPMVIEKKSFNGGGMRLLPKLSHSFQASNLGEILLSVGSPCHLPACFYSLNLIKDPSNESPLIAYEVYDQPQYRVTHALNLENNPREAAHIFMALERIWLDAQDCRTAWNIRACLKDIKNKEEKCTDPEGHELKIALKHFIGRLVHTTPFQFTDINRRSTSVVQYNEMELEQFQLPQMFALEISHLGAKVPTYTSLAFGELEVGEHGAVWGLGQDTTTKMELGAIVEQRSIGQLEIRASGILMTQAERSMSHITAQELSFGCGRIVA